MHAIGMRQPQPRSRAVKNAHISFLILILADNHCATRLSYAYSTPLNSSRMPTMSDISCVAPFVTLTAQVKLDALKADCETKFRHCEFLT